MTNEFDEALRRRWRGLMLALTLMLAFGLIAESLAPAFAAEDGRQREAAHAQTDRKREVGNRKKVSPEIIGGRKVAQGKITFMAFVLIEADDEVVQCGGSLIAPSYILTAAHCVQDAQEETLPPDVFTVVIGATDLNKVPSNRIRGVIGVDPHPGWNPATFENDVALLQLDAAVPQSIASPIALVAAGQTTFDGAGQPAEVAGWGLTENGFPSDQLREAGVAVVADSTCEAAYSDEDQGFVVSVMLCAAAPGKDSCAGDSGGPLFAQEFAGYKQKKTRTKHGKQRKKRVAIYRPVQMGIVSWGIDCADPEFPGVYTRLSAPTINNFVVQTVNGS